MSLYCKVAVTMDELEVVRVELVTRGLTYIDNDYTEYEMAEDFLRDQVTHIALYNDGKAFGWVDKDDPMETIDFQLFMRRLDMNLPPRRAFRKVATYKMPYYQTIEK